MEQSTVLEAIRVWLGSLNIPFMEKHHEPTRTSEESARARGESLSIGAKALVVKVDDVFRLFVLPANRRFDSAAVKRHYAAKKVRFADAGELGQLTGLVSGSVPPFGRPILELDLVADPSLLTEQKVAFNAGSLTDSIIMASTDYQRAAGATWLTISEAVAAS